MADTLFHKVWNAHNVRTLPSGQTQLFIGLHLIHEVTSPQAFDMLRQHGWKVAFPGAHRRDDRSHRADELAAASVPRRDGRGNDGRARAQLQRVRHQALSRRTSMEQGIVHVIGPQLGLTQPGMTIACGDSHTSTHGAFGAIAMGIGTSQVRDVLASQCLARRAAESPPHRRQRPAARRRLRERRHPHDHPHARRPGRRRASRTSTAGRRSTPCRWTSG